ncbi:MAG: hypothetical protein EOP56_10045 [Sphingobacteriales bacterium]|nr:MAG: hypothetical protein EOP56_10045 [Sphingobacteriales bacterium]
MAKLTIITEINNDGEICGRIQYGASLLTAVASNIDELTENFTEQLEDFYGLTVTEEDFEVVDQADIGD